MPYSKQHTRELSKCIERPEYFVNTYCQLYDAVKGEWVDFELWEAQSQVLQVFHVKQLVAALKARQVGLTWLALAYALWLMIFRPAASVLLFSKRDTESTFLLGDSDNINGDSRLRGMYHHLPGWMRSGYKVTNDSAHEWSISNGSTARAFPTGAGDSYTGSLVIVDEADLIPDLNSLMRSVKPTIDAGGKMFLISRSDKGQPNSEFKRLYRAAKRARSGLSKAASTDGLWTPLFIPWHARPGRTQEWYDGVKDEIEERTNSLDDLYEQYPATDDEALSARTQDKRIPYRHIKKCYHERPALPVDEVTEAMLAALYESVDMDAVLPGSDLEKRIEERKNVIVRALALPDIKIFERPTPGVEYVLGADPAEGNPESNESAATVLNRITGNQAAVVSGRIEPSVFGSYIALTCELFNDAQAMVERNNHGHAVIQWLHDNSSTHVMYGHDDKPGFSTSSLSKSLLYEQVVETLRTGDASINDEATYLQLQSIEAATLRAPKGQNDDRAMAFCLANTGRPRQGIGIYI